MGEVRGEAQVTQGLEALEQRQDMWRGMTAGPRVTLQQSNHPAHPRSGINRQGNRNNPNAIFLLTMEWALNYYFISDLLISPQIRLQKRNPPRSRLGQASFQILDTDEVPQRHTLRTQLTQWCLQSLSKAQDFSSTMKKLQIFTYKCRFQLS